jgi:superfamily II DNA/RNA helicase
MQSHSSNNNNNSIPSDTSQSAESEVQTFNDFGLHADLLKAITKSGYTKPTPIQAQAIPAVLAGRDVMGAAQTGTGKTAAFTLPVLHRIMPFASHSTSPARHPVRALILTPTRELADQVADNVERYCSTSALRSTAIFGGVDIRPQKEQLRQGCELLIATPGRLLDHLEQKNVNLSQVGVLVLDEADRMLDMGFMPDLERIVGYLPKQRQNLMFSATFSPDIRKLARNILREPVEITVANKNQTADTVSQVVYKVAEREKRAALLYLLMTHYSEQVIVFANTRLEVNRLSRFLNQEGVSAEPIHGDRSQIERTRTLEDFKAGKVQVLVATDVAARGLDVAGLPCVINYDLPFNPEDYVHRIGRTGRAGAKGTAIAFYNEAEDGLLLDNVQQLIDKKFKVERLDIPGLFKGRVTEQPRRSSSYHQQAKREPIDAFFYKPYEPSQASTVEASSKQPHNVSEKQEPMLAVLLGGGKKTKPQDN